MKHVREFVVNVLVGGLLIVVPVYLAVLLLLKAMQSLAKLVRPLAMLLPAWFPAEHLLSLLLVLLLCCLIGLAVRTRTGRVMRERLEKALFERLPGYALLRSLTQRLAGRVKRTRGSRRWSRLRRPWSPPSSLKSWRTGASRCSSRRCPRRSRAPSMCSARTGCIPWTSPSRRRSRPSRGGAQGPKTWSPP